jgi:hypothetical protein
LGALQSYIAAKTIAERDKSYTDLLPDIEKAISRLQR